MRTVQFRQEAVVSVPFRRSTTPCTQKSSSLNQARLLTVSRPIRCSTTVRSSFKSRVSCRTMSGCPSNVGDNEDNRVPTHGRDCRVPGCRSEHPSQIGGARRNSNAPQSSERLAVAFGCGGCVFGQPFSGQLLPTENVIDIPGTNPLTGLNDIEFLVGSIRSVRTGCLSKTGLVRGVRD